MAAAAATPGRSESGPSSSPTATIAGSNGRTRALASGPTVETRWKSVAIIGSVPIWAAHVTANGSRRTDGSQPSLDSMPGVSRMIAPVPAKDS